MEKKRKGIDVNITYFLKCTNRLQTAITSLSYGNFVGFLVYKSLFTKYYPYYRIKKSLKIVRQCIAEKEEHFLTQRFLLVFKKNSHPLS